MNFMYVFDIFGLSFQIMAFTEYNEQVWQTWTEKSKPRAKPLHRSVGLNKFFSGSVA